MRIRLGVASLTRTLWLHARDLEIERAAARALEGGPRALAELVERIRLCAALRTHHAPRGFGDALAGAGAPVPR